MHEGFRFGHHFKLLPAERLLLNRGEPVNLVGRAFDVLVALVRRGGRLISKSELLDEVWAGLVVEENNLAVHVAALRKLLGPEAVSTITGVGYRFAWEVFPIEAGEVGAALMPIAGRNPQFADPASSAPSGLPSGSPVADAPRVPTPRHNLPMRLPRLLGRETERADINRQVRDGASLLMLCGEAGIGKTLLAQTLAHDLLSHFRDGVFWVELALVQDAARIPLVIAEALRIALPGTDPLGELVHALQPLTLLLVLDNAEHLQEGAARVVRSLLQGTPGVAVLCTSQVPLKLAQEQVYRLDPLAVPPVGEAGEGEIQSGAALEKAATAQAPLAYAAVQLFVERARAADRHFEATPDVLQQVAELCRQLDGNSLAIELAAARVGPIGLQGLAAHLDDRLMLLAPVRAEERSRRNALAAAMDWSYALLSHDEQWVFRQLGVFRGGFALDWAALCVCDEAQDATRAASLIGELVDRSLVAKPNADRRRLHLLETGRLYALARLVENEELATAQARHAAAVRWLFDEAFQEFWQSPEEIWLPRYEPELENLRAALEWGAAHDAALAIGLFGSAWPLAWLQPSRREMQAWSQRLQPLLTDTLPTMVQARFWEAVCFAHSVDFPEEARRASQRGAELYAALGERSGQYRCLMEHTLNWRVDDARARAAAAAARAIEEADWPAWMLERGRTAEGMLEMGCGRFAQARQLYEAGFEVSQRGGYERGMRRTLTNLADLELADGRVSEAMRLGQLLRERAWHGPGCVTALTNLSSALIVAGDPAEARIVAREALHEAQRFDINAMWVGLDAMSLLAALEGRLVDAARITRAADAELARRGQHQRQPNEAREHKQVMELLASSPAALALLDAAHGEPPMRLEAALQLAFATSVTP